MVRKLTLRDIHKTLLNLERRAEKKEDNVIEETFVDAEPLLDILTAPLSQIIYGRRGTGKTHALKYCLQKAREQGDRTIYIDIRSVGSNGSLYGDSSVPAHERGLRLVVDILNALHEEMTHLALDIIDSAAHPGEITLRLDDLGNAVASVKIVGEVEVVRETKDTAIKASRASAAIESSQMSTKALFSLGRDTGTGLEEVSKTIQRGVEVRHLEFGRTQAALEGLCSVLGVERIWLFLDEWSETPREVQPYLADLIRKTVLPVRQIIVKIAAIEQRSKFVITKGVGDYIGIEVGADLSADLNLDEFLVFDYDEARAVAFFRELIYRNYLALGGDPAAVVDAAGLVNMIFTQQNAFEEFVRAVEGVPRDAINIVSKAISKSFGNRISIDDVRRAALDWYQQDKANIVNGTPGLQGALNHIIDEVIGNRKARAFLFASGARNEVVDRLYDARVLHLLRKNISSNEEPGKRYDAWKIDYGCYVDLIRTQRAPLGLLPDGEEGFIDVPTDDYRSIRRAILTGEDILKYERG